MASDWIKMRTDLYRDPKVCIIADILISKDGELARYVNQNCRCDMAVTRNVTRNATVGALVTVWGVLRHRGKRVGDDLFIKGATVQVIDDIADLPGFGSAMLDAGWVVDTDKGLKFPHFFEEHNVDPSEESKAKNAEKQKRYRDRLRYGNVTSQSRPREEKSREENKNPLTPTGDDQPAAPQKRKTRSPADSRPEESDPAFVAFWSRYPRKEAKPKAAVAFAAAVAGGVPAAEIMAGLERWRLSEQWAKDGGKFIPHSTTFLNQRRWQDNPRPETLTAASAPPSTFRDVILPKGTILPPER
jgi:hypothetical protein